MKSLFSLFLACLLLCHPAYALSMKDCKKEYKKCRISFKYSKSECKQQRKSCQDKVRSDSQSNASDEMAEKLVTPEKPSKPNAKEKSTGDTKPAVNSSTGVVNQPPTPVITRQPPVQSSQPVNSPSKAPITKKQPGTSVSQSPREVTISGQPVVLENYDDSGTFIEGVLKSPLSLTISGKTVEFLEGGKIKAYKGRNNLAAGALARDMEFRVSGQVVTFASGSELGVQWSKSYGKESLSINHGVLKQPVELKIEGQGLGISGKTWFSGNRISQASLHDATEFRLNEIKLKLPAATEIKLESGNKLKSFKLPMRTEWPYKRESTKVRLDHEDVNSTEGVFDQDRKTRTLYLERLRLAEDQHLELESGTELMRKSRWVYLDAEQRLYKSTRDRNNR